MDSEEEVRVLKDRNFESNLEIKTLSEEVQNLLQRHKKMTEDDQELESEVDECNKSLLEWEEKLNKFNDDYEEKMLKTLQSKIDNLQTELQEEEALTKSEMDKLKSQCIATDSVNMHVYNDVAHDTLIKAQEKLDTINEKLESEQVLNKQRLVEINNLKQQNKNSVAKLEDMSTSLEAMRTEFHSFQEVLESLTEKTINLNLELALLKGPSIAVQGKENSLFSEVENDRRKVLTKFKQMKSKYEDLKKTVASTNIQYENLKITNLPFGTEMRRETANIYNELITTLKTRVQNLEQSLSYYEKYPENLQKITLNVDNIKEVNTLVEKARKEVQTLKQKSEENTLECCFNGENQFKTRLENKQSHLQCEQKKALIQDLTTKVEQNESLIVKLQQQLEGHIVQSPAKAEEDHMPDTKQKKLRFAENS